MAGLWVAPEDLDQDTATSQFAVEACEAASSILWAMSGRKINGPITVTEIYGKQLPLIVQTIAQLELSITDMALIEATLPEYTLDLHNHIRLRGRPVTNIASIVTVSDGLTMDPSHYNLMNHATLEFDQYILDELEITYTYGGAIPVVAKMAARDLATQFALLWGGRADECSLPTRVTSISRQGVTFTILDSQDFIADLRTGVYSIDLFLKSQNPHKATAPSKVFSPDVYRGRRPQRP